MAQAASARTVKIGYTNPNFLKKANALKPTVPNPNLFFGIAIDPHLTAGKLAVLALAVLIGGLIGLERQVTGNPAGIRTHILVCLGAALMTLTSAEIGLAPDGKIYGDPGRIAAQVVTGIGFLGAGAIFRQGASIHGLTTAASIWITAGIGIALGASPHLGELGVAAGVLTLLTLTLLHRLETDLKLKSQVATLQAEVREELEGDRILLALLSEQHIQVRGIQSEAGAGSLEPKIAGATRAMTLQLRLPRTFDRDAFLLRLTREPALLSFHLDS